VAIGKKMSKHRLRLAGDRSKTGAFFTYFRLMY